MCSAGHLSDSIGISNCCPIPRCARMVGPVRFDEERGVFFTDRNDIRNNSGRNITTPARSVQRVNFLTVILGQFLKASIQEQVSYLFCNAAEAEFQWEGLEE